VTGIVEAVGEKVTKVKPGDKAGKRRSLTFEFQCKLLGIEVGFVFILVNYRCRDLGRHLSYL